MLTNNEKAFDPEKGSTGSSGPVHLEDANSAWSSTRSQAHVPLYDGDKVNLIPMPTSDPNDPLNLPMWQKVTIILSLCLFGAMAAAAELILGAMLPVFDIQYAGLDPKLVLPNLHLPPGANGLADLKLLGGPPIWRVYLLASLPVIMMGIVNFFFVPLAISIGRRPVVLGSGLIAIGGAVWAGKSTSLNSHLGARSIQAVGAGTVESLLPFIIQDMVFFHQRNTAISSVFVCQGLIIVGLGIAAPYVIIELSWRWLYFITAIAAGVFLVGVFFSLPETRYRRSSAELKGIPTEPLPSGQDRPAIDTEKHTPRSFKRDLAIFQGKMEWGRGVLAFWHVITTFFYPHIFFITLLNSVMIAAAVGAGYTAAPTLLTEPYSWPFEHLGLSLLTILIAAIATYVVSGLGADKFANWMSKKTGRREPEIQALNLILPTGFGLIGTILFGIAGDDPNKYPWPVFLLGLGFIGFGFLSTSSIGIVYVLESYPNLAGPAIVNIASFRCLIAFLLTFRISEWVADMGYLKTFGIYAGIMGGFILFIPIIYVFGPGWRRRWPGPKESVTDRTLPE